MKARPAHTQGCLPHLEPDKKFIVQMREGAATRAFPQERRLFAPLTPAGPLVGRSFALCEPPVWWEIQLAERRFWQHALVYSRIRPAS